MFEIFQWINKLISIESWVRRLKWIFTYYPVIRSKWMLALNFLLSLSGAVNWKQIFCFHQLVSSILPPLPTPSFFLCLSVSVFNLFKLLLCAPLHLPIAALSAVINQLQLPFGIGITSNHCHQFLDSVVGSVLQPRQMPFDHQMSTNHLLQKTLSWLNLLVFANWKEIITELFDEQPPTSGLCKWSKLLTDKPFKWSGSDVLLLLILDYCSMFYQWHHTILDFFFFCFEK